MKKNGFTLIELMIVIIIIGILISISLPNFLSAQEKAKISSIKSNMKTFQVMLESYSVDWGGTYPRLPEEFKEDSLNKKYYKNYKNPITGKNLLIDNTITSEMGNGTSLAEFSTGISLPSNSNSVYPGTGGENCRGQVIYRRALSTEFYTKYTIYGLDSEGKFIKNNGIFFSISNQ